MTIRERILSVMRKEKPDRIPWVAYGLLLPRGQLERETREKGCGLYMYGETYQTERSGVSLEENTIWDQRNRAKIVTRTYHTPLGNVSEKLQFRLGL